MTARLEISLVNPMQGGNAYAAALADVIPVDRRSGTHHRNVAIPVTGDRGTLVDVVPGRYLVQTTLPSGELVDAEVSVADGETQQVLLHGALLTHEWLGWQRFSGTMQPLWDQTRSPTSPVHASLVASGGWLDHAPVPGTPLPAVQGDQLTSAFELHAPPGGSEQRVLVVIRRQHHVDVIAAPAPWGFYSPATVQIAAPHDPDLPVSIAIQDPELGPLLGYLSAGAVASAGALLGKDDPQRLQAIEMLAAKRQNPYGAAVAGYVLLSGSRDPRRESWASWLTNLANHFPWLPDGAVLAGWLEFRDGNPAQAAQWFQRAIARGMPTVTGVLRLLHQGLLSVGDPASVAVVSKTLSYADLTQPFVTLAFDED